MKYEGKRATKRIAAGLVSAGLAIGTLAITGASPVGATQVVTESRVAGLDRYATAAAVAQASTTSNNPNIILVSGTNFPDGLAAAGLAGAAGAPILLTAPDSLPAVTANAMAVIFGSAATKTVHVLGGESAISAAVATQIQSLGYTVNRVSGTDRYGTAAAIATLQATLAPIGTTSVTGVSLKTAILATGANFPDALAAGTPAYFGKHPILLTSAASLPAATKSALTSLAIKRVIVLGGTSAVSDAVLTEISALGISTTRVAGSDRGATAAALADTLVASAAAGGFDLYSSASSAACLGTGVAGPNMALVIDGDSFADALAAAPHAGICKAPILIAGNAASATFATANAAKIGLVRAIGGTSAVSAAELTAVKTAATQATPTGTISANQSNAVIRVDFSEKMAATSGSVLVNNGTNLCSSFSGVAVAPTSSTMTTAASNAKCYVVTEAGATSSYLLVKNGAAVAAGTALAANDAIAVSGFVSATGARAMAPASGTVATPAVAPTLTVTGATIGSTSIVLTYSRPVTAIDETAITVDGTALSAATDADVSSGRKTSFAVTVSALTAGQVIVVAPAAATAAAGTPNQIASAVTVTVPAAGAAPAAVSAVGTLTEQGGVLNTTGIVGTNVIIVAKQARPDSGTDGSTDVGVLKVALIDPVVATATTTASSATDATTGVTTITVTLASSGSAITATPTQVAAALNTGVGSLVTAFASDPTSATAVAAAGAADIPAGTRSYSVVVTFSKAIKNSSFGANAVGLDANNDTFAEVSQTATSDATSAAAGKATATFNLNVGATAVAAPAVGTAKIRLNSGAVQDLAGQASTAGVLSLS